MYQVLRYSMARAALIVLLTLSTPGGAPAIGWSPIAVGLDRVGNALCVDPEHDQLVSFGGYTPGGAYTSDVWVRSLAGGGWRQLAVAGPPPSARGGARMVFDAAAHRLLVCSGYGPYSPNGSWPGPAVYSLTVGASPEWQLLVPESGGPTLEGCSIVLDSRRHRLVAFGGGFTRGMTVASTDQVWIATLDGTPQWSELVIGGAKPSPRWSALAAFDSTGDGMIVYGGANFPTMLDDAWTLRFSGAPTWSPIPPSEPWPTELSSGWIDERTRHLVLHLTGELWSLHLDASPPYWQTSIIAGGLPPNPGATAWDAARNRLHMSTTPTGVGTGSDWDLRVGDGPDTTWNQVFTPSGYAPPSPRAGAAMIYDDVRDRFVVSMGADASGNPAADTYTVDAATLLRWSPGGNGPTARSAPAAVLDRTNDRILLFGGRDASGDRNDLWAYALANGAWTLLAPGGAGSPAGRASATLVSDESDECFYLFGGAQAPVNSVTNGLADCWKLTFPGGIPEWTPVGDAPRALYHHTATWDAAGGRMLVLGGVDWPLGSGFTAGHWLLELSFAGGVPAWHEVETAGMRADVNLNGHAMAFDASRRRLIVLGGNPASPPGPYPVDLVQYQLDLTSMTWDSLPPPGPQPANRMQAGAAYDPVRDRVVMFGGAWMGTTFGDAWLLPFDDPTPALAALVSAEWTDGAVDLRWHVSEPGGAYAVDRRGEAGEESRIALTHADGASEVACTDHGARPGVTYVYRLSAIDGGQATVLDELSFTVPCGTFFLRTPLVSDGRLTLRFAVPERLPATLEVFDPAGRRVARRDFVSLAAGERTERFARPMLPPGVYLVRLQTPVGTLRSRAVVLR